MVTGIIEFTFIYTIANFDYFVLFMWFSFSLCTLGAIQRSQLAT